jgi:hypothetical protein
MVKTPSLDKPVYTIGVAVAVGLSALISVGSQKKKDMFPYGPPSIKPKILSLALVKFFEITRDISQSFPPKREAITRESQIVPVCMKQGAKAAAILFVVTGAFIGTKNIVEKLTKDSLLPFKTTPKVESTKRFENARPAIAGK